MKTKKNTKIEPPILLPRENPHLFGHEDAIATFLSAHKNGNLPGTWLISGPRGIGKATLAYRLAKFILYNAQKQSTGLFANELPESNLSIPQNSPVFTKVSIGSHPDLLVLEAGMDSKSASGDILVDNAREIGKFLHLTSSETAYRIVIIDSIDDMNTNAANSILKLLEEPSKNSIFILVSHAPGRLLPTIRSRCRHIKLREPGTANALQVLHSIAPDIADSEAINLIDMASGSPGNAYDFYLHKGIGLYNNIATIISSIPQLDMIAVQKLSELASGKANDNSWRIIRMLLSKILIDLTKQVTKNNLPGKIINEKVKLSVAISAQRLVQIWEESNSLLEEADRLHLDRRATLVKVFTLFVRK